jgi:hypothetical protein
MSRVPLDTVVRTKLGPARPGIRLYVRERGTEVSVTGYTTEAGSTKVTYPLVSDAEGRFPTAWFPAGSYDLYCPEDALNPTQPWSPGEAGAGGPLAAEGLGVIMHGSTAGTARGTNFAQYVWIGSVSPTKIAKNDTWIDTTGNAIWIGT